MPGTSSSSRCPSLRNAVKASRTTRFLPSSTSSTAPTSRSRFAANRVASSGVIVIVCSSLIGSSTWRSRPRPQHPTRPVSPGLRVGDLAASSPSARSGRRVAVDAAPEGRRQAASCPAPPSTTRSSSRSSHTRLGSANVSDGLRVATACTCRPRPAAAPGRAAAHLEPGRLAERAVRAGRGATRCRGTRAGWPICAPFGVDRDDLQARRARGVDPGRCSDPRSPAFIQSMPLATPVTAPGAGPHDRAGDLGVRRTPARL